MKTADMSLADMPLVEISQSASFKRLLSLARKSRVDTEKLRDILWQITAHCHLIGLVAAAYNLREMLDLIPDTWNEAVRESGIKEWALILDWIIDNRDTLTKEMGEHVTRQTNTSGRNPMSGHGLSTFSAYGALCEPIMGRPDNRRYLLIMGQFIIAYIIAIKETPSSTREDYEGNGLERKWSFLPNGVESAARAVRRTADTRYSDFLAENDADGTHGEFIESLGVQIELEESSAIEKRLAGEHESKEERACRSDMKALANFLEKCHGLRDWREKDGGGSIGSGGHQWIGRILEMHQTITCEHLNDGDDEDPYFDWGSVDLVKIRPITPRQKQMLLESDSHPDEALSENDIVLDHQDCRELTRDAGSFAQAAVAKAKHITRSNQLFEWTYHGLTIHEIASVLHTAGEAYRELTAKNAAKREDKRLMEALTLIHIMLWTGSDADRAASIRICIEGMSTTEELAVVIPKNQNIDKICWRIAALGPDYKTDLQGTPGQTRTNDAYLDLPDYIGVAPFINRIMSGRAGVIHNASLFETQPQILIREATRWLNDRFPDKRITMHKIAEALWLQIVAETGDPATASLVTGRMHTLARVRIFYSTLSVRYLQQQYEKVVLRLTGMLYQVVGKRRPKAHPWLPNGISQGAIGARLCPTVQAVKDMFEKLIADIRAASRFTDRKQFIEYHNLYTLYCILFFGYVTGYRAVTTPYLELADIQFSRKFASLSDKDDANNHKTRMVLASKLLEDQMKSYDDHIASVKQQIGAMPSKIENEPCFFLNEQFRPIEVRPGTIHPLLTKYLNVRANTHRRFLRSELIERGCECEAVDAFLGHWQRGEEPHGRYSSFLYEEYLETLNNHLTGLLDKIGLTKILRSRFSV